MGTGSPEQGARLEQVIDSLGYSQVSLAQAVSLSQGYISQMITGARPISKKLFQFIAKQHPEIHINWILTGNDEMLVAKTVDTVQEPPHSGYATNWMLDKVINELESLKSRITQLENDAKRKH